MNDGLIPYRYAKALYKTAEEKGKATEVYDEMKEVASSFASSPELQRALSNPFITRADKEALLVASAGKYLDDTFKAFVDLILDNRREEFAWRMALAYRDIYRKANDISQVAITTASELPEKDLKRLRDIVQKSFPGRKLEFTYHVDPKLIGGFVVDVDSVRMDASLSNEIKQLRHQLLTGK